jgi:diadenosine tetraphosphate (Ap4A) HIT family hydrolase
MLDRIWNGWRAEYVQRDSHGVASDKSVFSEILESGLPDEETFIVHRGQTCFVIMNAFPYSSGHVLVIPYREVPDLELLTEEETTEIWLTVTKVVQTIKAEFKPQGMNVGINLGHAAGGSVAQHLHIHVVPRWGGDSNFMVAVATTKILPEALDVTASRIRKRWKEFQ